MRRAAAMVAFLVLVFSNFSHAQQSKPPPQPSELGRYQLWAPPGDQHPLVYLLDSWTGKTWLMKSPKETPGRVIFVYIERLDTPQAVTDWLRYYVRNEKPELGDQSDRPPR